MGVVLVLCNLELDPSCSRSLDHLQHLSRTNPFPSALVALYSMRIASLYTPSDESNLYSGWASLICFVPWSFHRFAHSFHPFYKQNPNMTKAIHQEFVASLQKNIQVCVCVTATDCYCAMLLTAVKTYVQTSATAVTFIVVNVKLSRSHQPSTSCPCTPNLYLHRNAQFLSRVGKIFQIL